MYIVIGAHRCPDDGIMMPIYYGTASDLALARCMVRREYLYTVFNITDLIEAHSWYDEEEIAAKDAEATQASLDACVRYVQVGEYDSIQIIHIGEEN